MAAPLVIDNWQKGVATSPFTGFASMVGMDIFRKPGIIQNGVGLVNSGSLTPTALPTAQVIDINGAVYVGCNDGKIFKNGVLLTTADAAVHDMIIVNNYLIISKANGTLDLYGSVTGSPSYTVGWKSGLNTSAYGYKKMFLGQDNVVYIGNEGQLASITGIVTTGGVYAGTGSWTLNISCLSTGVPSGRIIQTICEQNRYVVIVTSYQSGSTGKTRVYFMDRGVLDPSKTSFSLSIGVDIPERKINQIINQNNRLVLFGNDTGTFYTTNSTSYGVITTLPNRIIGQQYLTYPNGICLLNNEVLVGVGLSTTYTGSTQVGQGVFSLQGSSVILKNINSQGNVDLGSVNYGSLIVTGVDAYQVGYSSMIASSGITTFLVDNTGNLFLAGNSSDCFFESAMYDTGTAILPRKFQKIQFNLANNFVSGQIITVYYRAATNDAYSTAKTFTFATYGSVNSFHAPFPTENTTNIQLKVYFNCGSSAISGNEIQLQSIILT